MHRLMAAMFLGLLITSPAFSGSQVTIYARGLEIPWAIAFSPDGRVLITERPGRVRMIRNGRLDPNPVAVLPVAHVGEGGLLGLALDPGFPRRPFVYVYYTYDANGLRNRVERLREQDGRLIRDRIILDDIPGAFVHDGGRIAFGPDGMLYIGTGDAQKMDLAQNPQSLAGKILRVTPDGGIPRDNPMAGSPVYSLGHRNVQGLAWHPETKRLYATEHGPSGERGCCQDEVNVIRPAGNYGWPDVTGDGHERDSRYIAPLTHSGRETWAPSGAAFISSGPWTGRFLFAALRASQLRMLILNENGLAVVRQERLIEDFGRLRDVVEGPDRALYVLTNNRDGRGSSSPDDDRVLRVAVTR